MLILSYRDYVAKEGENPITCVHLYQYIMPWKMVK